MVSSLRFGKCETNWSYPSSYASFGDIGGSPCRFGGLDGRIGRIFYRTISLSHFDHLSVEKPIFYPSGNDSGEYQKYSKTFSAGFLAFGAVFLLLCSYKLCQQRG